jgi:hypothetical protein
MGAALADLRPEPYFGLKDQYQIATTRSPRRSSGGSGRIFALPGARRSAVHAAAAGLPGLLSEAPGSFSGSPI